MDIQTRKINFIQEFLKIQNEQLIKKLEDFFITEKKKNKDLNIKKLSLDEFNKIIDIAEKDAEKGNYSEAKEVLKKIDSWT